MTFRTFLGLIFILLMTGYVKPAFAGECDNDGGLETQLNILQSELGTSDIYTCVSPNSVSSRVNNNGNTDVYAEIPIPRHNGRITSEGRGDLKICRYSFFPFANDGWILNEGTVPQEAEIPSLFAARERSTLGYYIDVHELDNPNIGQLEVDCSTLSGTPDEESLQSAIKVCRIQTTYIAMTPRTFVGSGCVGASGSPTIPEITDLRVDQFFERSDDYEAVFQSSWWGGGQISSDFNITGANWGFGEGTTRDNGLGHTINFLKPIDKTLVTLSLSHSNGQTDVQSIPVYFAEPNLPKSENPTEPKADFTVEVLGRMARLTNTSNHPTGETLTHLWDFGDGSMSESFSPEHVYDEPGNYMVKLLVTDEDGDMDDAVKTVTPENGLFIDVNLDSNVFDIDEDIQAKVTVLNYESDDIDTFTLKTLVNTDFLAVTRGPSPSVLLYIPKNGNFSTNYVLTGKMSGSTEIVAVGKGRLVTNEAVEAEQQKPIYIRPDLDIELSTSATFETRVGEEVTITLTVANNDNETITGIRLDALMVDPHRLLTFVSGPLDPTGVNLRVNSINLAAGATTTVTWTYIAEERGVTNLRAFLTSDRIRGSGSVTQDDSTVLAIESAAFKLSELRLQGGRPTPGTFSFIRGTITNVGGVNITDIDFKVSGGEPRVERIESLLERQPSNVSPRISLLEPGEGNSRGFIIPIGMLTNIGGRAGFTIPVEFSGKAKIDGQDVVVVTTMTLNGAIDRDKYWIDILPEVESLLLNGFISFIDNVDDWSEDSTLGGIAVGSTEGILRALTKMGEGAFTAGDIIGSTAGQFSVDGGEALTQDGLKIYNAIIEYNNTTSLKVKATDLAALGETISVEGVRIVADWMNDVEIAGRKGDVREIAALFTEPVATIGTGEGVETLGARLLSKLIKTAPVRKLLRGKEKKGKVINENTPELEVQDYYRGHAESWDDVPDGVPLTGETVKLAGIADDELAFMIETAKETGGTFLVRSRPPTATKWANANLNAKPIDIKIKSVNEIDTQWLGYSKADEGLIVLREPKDPYPALKEGLKRGELDPEDRQIYAIIERYHAKKAEFETRDKLLDKLNNQKSMATDSKGNVIEGDGIIVRRFGEPKLTKVSVDSEGYLIFDYNMKRVYSDVDLLGFGRRDASNLDQDIHKNVLDAAGFGIDLQHGAPLQTSDFPNEAVARKVAGEQISQHVRGGDGGGLIIINPDSTTKGYINSFDISTGSVPGSNYDHYGQIVTNVSVTGGQSR